MKEEEKEIIIKEIENNSLLYNQFEEFLSSQDLDINFILYEDEAEYFDLIYYTFIEKLKKIKKGGLKE